MWVQGMQSRLLHVHVNYYYFMSTVGTSEFSQLTASSSASCRIVSPPSNVVCRQESTMWLMVWADAQHTSSSVTTSAATCTWRLCGDLVLSGSGSTKTTNSKEDQSLADGWWDPPLWHGWYSSFRCVFMSTGDKSDQMGRRDESRGDG